MARDCIFSQQTKAAQERVFRMACDPRRHGLTLKSISDLSGIPYSTIRSYAGHNEAIHEMPLSALRKLSGILPVELLSDLAADGFHLVPDTQVDIDDLARGCMDFGTTYAGARHPESEWGIEIGPDEDKALKVKAAGVMRSV